MTARPKRGRVTGYVLKLVRESIPKSQLQLAAELGVDRATVQGWESGRRSYTSVPLGQAVAMRHRLARMGASADLLGALDHAAEADFLLSEVIEVDPSSTDLSHHALGWTVLTHGVTEMLSWAVVGQPPQVFSRRIGQGTRRGPVAAGPELDAAERRTFFANLQVIADRTGGRDDAILLHRQACFLAGSDPFGAITDWLVPESRIRDYFACALGWSTRWAAARSVAASLAKQGDPEPLRDFIAHAHPDVTCEIAGLNYWAYWVGEIGQMQRDDLFMINPRLAWRGTRLMRHLVDRLEAGHAFVDLNVHSLWALLAARRGLAHDDPVITRRLFGRAQRLLDEGEISRQSRRELTSVLYGLRMDGFAGKADT